MNKKNGDDAWSAPRRFSYFSLGFLRPKFSRLLRSTEYQAVPFGMGKSEAIGVWGRKSPSRRGRYLAKRLDKTLFTFEDAYIRSIHPGWKEAPLGLMVDQGGVYFDAGSKSDIFRYIRDARPEQQTSARIARMARLGISKYNAVPRGNWAHENYILVIDQTYGDASVELGGADSARFDEMLETALAENPDQKILIRGHPAGLGYLSQSDGVNNNARVHYSTQPANIWDVLAGAKRVYAVTSLAGFEAVMAGHRPVIFAQPFYSGWGITDDRYRQIRGTASHEAIFQAGYIDFPIWFDEQDSICDFDRALDVMEMHLAVRDRATIPMKLCDIKAWKRPHMKSFFPNQKGDQIVRWGKRHHPDEWVCEDGFLRSQGLGAKLTPPVSLVVDQQGIYFDPNQPSDLEVMIQSRKIMDDHEIKRAEKLRQSIVEAGLSKYNLENGELPELPPDRHIILVPGQVADDRSVKLGATGAVKSNQELLRATRSQFPESYIIYKPHPDVVAGLRAGKIDPDQADLVYQEASLEPLWPNIDMVSTLTSLTGFEALLRQKTVHCYGMPFYGGWGLTVDHAPAIKRRHKTHIEALIYASLIDYPIYYDPILRRHCTVETIVERLSSAQLKTPLVLRCSAALQIKVYRAVDWAKNHVNSAHRVNK